MKKILTLVLALLCGAVVAEEAEKTVKLVPGAACHVWDENAKTKPEAPPAGGFVDKHEEYFSRESLEGDKQLKGLLTAYKPFFLIWSGFLKIDKPGRYRLTVMRAEARGNVHDWAESNIRLVVQKRNLIELKPGEKKKSGSALVSLTAGMHPVIIQANLTPNSHAFTLLCAQETAVKAKVISPAALYHQDDED